MCADPDNDKVGQGSCCPGPLYHADDPGILFIQLLLPMLFFKLLLVQTLLILILLLLSAAAVTSISGGQELKEKKKNENVIEAAGKEPSFFKRQSIQMDLAKIQMLLLTMANCSQAAAQMRSQDYPE